MTNVTLESVVKGRPEHLTQTPSEEALYMMDGRSGRFLHLNRVGRVIWEEVQQSHRVQDVCAALRVRFAVTDAQCEQEVLSFLNDLHGKGLLHVESR